MATMKHPSVRNKSSYCLRINRGCQRGRSTSEGDVATMGIPAAPDEALEVVMQKTHRQYQDTDQNVMLAGGQQVRSEERRVGKEGRTRRAADQGHDKRRGEE